MQPAVYIGTYAFNNQLIGLDSDLRFQHVYVIGKPGMGKSTVLENLAIQDIHNGEGITFIDPQAHRPNVFWTTFHRTALVMSPISNPRMPTFR
jgi:hypothetical protein